MAGCADRLKTSWAEYGFIALGIMYYDGAFVGTLRAARGETIRELGSTDIVSTVYQSLILLVMATLISVRLRRVLPHLRHLAPAAAICGFCLVSTLWSDNPLTTARRASSLLVCVMFGIYAFDAVGLDRLLAVFARTAVFLGILSVAVFVLAPQIGHEDALGYENAMRGVFSQKNVMAECMLLAATCYCHVIARDRRLRWGTLAPLSLLAACIVMARSATSLGVLGMVVLAAAGSLGHNRLGWRIAIGFVLLWTAVAAATLLIIDPGLALGLVGRDTSMTGRLPVWREVVGAILSRPFWGHGYAGFWNPDSREVQYLWGRIGWNAPDSHNGYLETMVQVGVIGLSLYLWAWARIIARALRADRAGGLPTARWMLLAMLTNVLLNLDEGPLPFANAFTMMMPPMLIALGQWHRRRRPAAAPLRMLNGQFPALPATPTGPPTAWRSAPAARAAVRRLPL